MTKKHRKEIFKSLFEKHYPRLCAIAVGYISNKDDAEDIVQELFITAWNKELEALPEKEFAAYMTTAVKNGSLSFLRKKSERMVSIEDHPMAASSVPDESGDGYGNGRKSPEEMLEAALATLPPKCKEIFLMAKLKGMKYRNIAENLNLSEKTIENQMTKAIKLLRVYVAENCFVLAMIFIFILSVIVNQA